jgi:hypothetical protein
LQEREAKLQALWQAYFDRMEHLSKEREEVTERAAWLEVEFADTLDPTRNGGAR